MKILITGHKGFIGSYLTRELDRLNLEWVGYDLKEGKDIRNRYMLYEFFDFYRPEKVVHLAALAGVRRGEEFPEEYLSTNVTGTLNVVKNCEKFYVDRLINFSSSSVYGEGKPPVKEQDPKNPKAMYGLTKLMAEKIVESSKINSITIRPFTVYGENGRPDMVIYKWINQILSGKPISFYGNGFSKRGYVNVNDLVDGVIKVLTSDLNPGTKLALNLGGHEVVSLRDLLGMFIKYSRKSFEVESLLMPSSDIGENWADTTLAETLFGWTPKRKFEVELKKIIKKEL